MRGFLVQEAYRRYATITEISYEKEAKVMVMGVKKIKDVIGELSWLPYKIERAKVYPTIEAAISVVKPECERRLLGERELLCKLEDALNAEVNQ